MHNTTPPPESELPSTGRLIRSTLIAIVVAGVLLVTIVLPAEYAIDITGFGRLVGLQRMGEIKVSLAEEAAEEEAAVAAAIQGADPTAEAPPADDQQAESGATLEHETTITLGMNESVEIKLDMKAGKSVEYVWQTDGAPASFDLHGDSKGLNISYHSYAKGSEARREGTLVAAFDGAHGWFWRNRSPFPMTITLDTSGEYSDLKRYD